jgi:hypothetical protein
MFNSHETYHPFLSKILAQIEAMSTACMMPTDSSQSLHIEEFQIMTAACSETSSLAFQRISLATLGMVVCVNRSNMGRYSV